MDLNLKRNNSSDFIFLVLSKWIQIQSFKYSVMKMIGYPLPTKLKYVFEDGKLNIIFHI